MRPGVCQLPEIRLLIFNCINPDNRCLSNLKKFYSFHSPQLWTKDYTLFIHMTFHMPKRTVHLTSAGVPKTVMLRWITSAKFSELIFQAFSRKLRTVTAQFHLSHSVYQDITSSKETTISFFKKGTDRNSLVRINFKCLLVTFYITFPPFSWDTQSL